MNKKILIGCFMGILVMASFLRFVGLRERGIFLCDEGDYLSGGRTVAAALDYAVKKIAHRGEISISFSEYLSKYGGGYASAVKPGYYLLIALSFLSGGVHDYSALYLSAVLGILAIVVIFLIARLLYNRRIALYSAILLSFSPYHINYSRSAFSVSSAVFFLYLGLYFLLRYFRDLEDRGKDNPLYLIFSGAALGYSFSCHYNLIATTALIFLLCVFFLFKNSRLGRLRHLIVSFAVPLILLEIPYWIVKYLTKGMTGVTSGSPYKIKTYFEQLFFIMTQTFLSERPQAPFFSYTDLLFRTEGPVILILFLFASIFIMRRIVRTKNNGDLCLFAMGPLMFILFSFLGEKAPRTILSVMPAFYIISAASLSGLETGFKKTVRHNRVFYLSLILPLWTGIIVSQCYFSYDYVRFRSPYRSAIDYMELKGENGFKHFSTNPPVSIFYAGLENTNPCWDITLEDARRLHETQGYRFLVLEPGGEDIAKYRSSLVDAVLKSKTRPVFEKKFKPLPLILEDLFFYRYEEDRPRVIYYRYKNVSREDYPSVRVIDLDDFFR